jgi:hypothetical protein
MFLVNVHGKLICGDTFELVTGQCCGVRIGTQRKTPQGRAVKWQNATAGLEVERERATLMNHERPQSSAFI